MTKAEEFLALCPQPKASPVSCSGPLRATVATGVAAGRYIKGDVLTVAVWGRAKSPLVVWYFCGEEWTGTLRGNKAADRRDLRVEWVEPAQHGGSLRYREVSIMQEEERLLREYFGCTDKISPMELIYKAQNARSQRLRSERNQRQAEETRQYMNRLPPLPDDFEKRILKSCSDAVFLWFKNRKVKTILPGGEPGNMWVQDVRCDSCGGEYTTEAESLSHLGRTKCAACGKTMLAHNTRYGAKRKEQARTFVMAQETPDGLWLRRFLVFFSFHEKKANLEVYNRDIYLIDTKRKAIHWKSEYRWQEKRSEYVMAQSAALEKMFVCSQGMYSGSAMVYMDEGLEKQVEKHLGMSWVKRYYKSADIMDICLLWRKIKTVPMLESLIKTGWCNEFLKLFYGACRHTWLNLKSKTYYGVFGLNRQEMRIVGKAHNLQAVERAYNWKAAGLAITEENLKMVKEIWSPAEVQRLGKRFGTGKVLKYLRQCTRRNGGNGKVIDSHITSDWIDYIRMAEKLGLQLELDIVRFPLDLKRRHNELASQVKEQQAMARASQRKAAIEARAQALEEKFSIKKIMRKAKKLYEYAGDTFCICVPEGAADIISDGEFLDHCVPRSDRYYERISERESYIMFLRRAEKPDVPWYTLEVEPGGTIRQKRSYGNEQYDDLKEAAPFLEEWQRVVASRIGDDEKMLAQRARGLRLAEFAELKEKQTVIRNGKLAGKLLVEELIADLIENKCG